MIQRRRKVLTLIILIIVILLTGCSSSSKVKVAPKLNAKAPNFTATNLDGEKITLNDISDKITIVAFWKIQSPSSQRQLEALQRIQNKFGDKVKIIAVNVQDSDSDINNFVNQNDYNFEIITDKDGKISNQYALAIFPTAFLIDKEGIIKEIKKYDEITENDNILNQMNS